MGDLDRRPWWSRAIFYQAYPRSFVDSNSDGVGDLAGVASKLDYLELLGIDAIWLNPVMVSPMADHGYDVADPRDIDPLFGNLEALDGLVQGAHARGIKLTMDLVPNHTSSQHPWFLAALAAGPETAQRERYIFRTAAAAMANPAAQQLGVRLRRTRPGPASPNPTAIPGSGTCISSTPNSRT